MATYARRDVPGRVVLQDGGVVPDDLWLHAEYSRPTPEVRQLSMAAIGDAMSGQGNDVLWSVGEMVEQVPIITRCKVAENGRFTMGGFPAEGAWIQVEHNRLYQAEPVRYTGREPELVVVLSSGGAITGRVLDPDGKPLEGAEVQGNTPIDPYFMFSGGAQSIELRREHTDATGSFSFAPVPAGVGLRLHASDDQGAWRTTTLDVPALGPGESRSVELRLGRGAVLAGVVLAERDEPVHDVEVVLQPAAIDMSQLDTLGRLDDTRQTTDEQGRFRFQGLPDGKWLVALSSESYLPARTESVSVREGTVREDLLLRARAGLPVAGVVVDRQGAPITLAEVKVALPPSFVSMRANADRGLRPTRSVDDQGHFHFTGYEEGPVRIWVEAPGFVFSHFDAQAGDVELVLSLPRKVNVSGIAVSLADGEPLQDYTLQLNESGSVFDMSKMLEMEDRMRNRRGSERVRSEHGLFVLDGVSPGTYDLTISAEGHARTVVGGVVVDPEHGATGLVITVPEEAKLRGRVVDARTGLPLPGVEISTAGSDMMAMWGAALGGGSLRTLSDAQGEFVLAGLGAEPVNLSLSHDLYMPRTLDAERIKPGEQRSLGDVTLSPGGVIWGRVTDIDGRPESGVNVLAADSMGRNMRRDLSDESGYYRVQGLAPGSYNVMRMDMRMSIESDNAASFLEGMMFKPATLVADEELRVDLSARREGGSTLEGVVRSAAGPEASATLWLVREDGDSSTRFGSTEADGRYALGGLDPGRYLLSVLPSSEMVGGGTQPSSPVVLSVNLGEGETRRLDVDVPGGSLRGVVVAEEGGRALGNVRLLLHRTDEGLPASRFLALLGGRVGEAFSDSQGRFEFRHLPPGSYSVVAGGQNIVGMGESGWASRRVDGLTVREGSPAPPVEIALRPGAAIRGTVRDRKGSALAGVPVWLRSEATGEWLSTLSELNTDGAGRFTVNSLEPGSWTVAAGGTTHALTLLEGVRARRDEVAETDVTLSDGVEVFVDPGPWDPQSLVPHVQGARGVLPTHLVSVEALVAGFRPGPLRIGRIEPGPYDVVILREGQVVLERHVTVQSGDSPFTLTLDDSEPR